MKRILIFTLIFITFLGILIFIENKMSYKLEIDEEIKSKYSQQKTWDIILKAFKDSSEVLEWPDNEWIRSDQVIKGSEITVQYKILTRKFEYKYLIKELSNYEIIYSPIGDHPLIGDINVRVEKDGDKSKIIWKGSYQTDSVLAKIGFEVFTNKFFRKLNNNLAD